MTLLPESVSQVAEGTTSHLDLQGTLGPRALGHDDQSLRCQVRRGQQRAFPVEL
jgi:hypothetical protein